MSYQLQTLSFEYDALEPFIDAQTMEIHHTKHHQGYVSKFNNAIEGTEYEDSSIEEILASASELPPDIRNNGGGHYNHSLFWNILSPNGGATPEGELADAINSTFDSFDGFKDQFTQEAGSRFGSGWAWLVVTGDNQLAFTSTPNQDNPLMDVTDVQGTPILGIDVWEHAYYLNYQNKRGAYIDAFWNVVNWDAVAENYRKAKV
ncbi:superoxide dismutase [Aliifodinibius sp. S!AR15-10]|uniref:superoxide dismutase n=1 Tax=Aliifodinibius sp. S!AR15-10 TaxID=2950437 RepID=UPI002857DC4A|nr:superoxide dismutase [Aliifodinibius sp. S!AR15-10]MDR8393759.1 superoxide dismutase [Aliifodinibius sp. S!AR15-10]